MAGSSPRVRGKHRMAVAQAALIRLIPACAGKTERPGRTSAAAGAHPRVCGENNIESFLGSVVGGSSPRVRGKPSLRQTCIGMPGLIPACAGKTVRRKFASATVRAHPRVCGENVEQAVSHRGTPGSSPRVRGKRRLDRRGCLRARLIPACAGKTSAA